MPRAAAIKERTQLLHRWISRPKVFGLLLPLVAVSAAGTIWTLDPDFLGLRAGPGPAGAQSSLDHSLPNDLDPDGHRRSYLDFTAAELNRIGQGSDLRELHFVPADVPSTSPAIVSVNPIDEFTWAAASLSDQDGRCYVILAEADRTNPEFGDVRHGWIPLGAPCIGTSANRATATLENWPNDG